MNFRRRAPEIRPCPVCDGLARRVLHRQRFMDGPLGDGYDVVVCGACGAGFADGIPTQAELDAYYAGRSKYTYDQTGGAESPYDFRRFERIADQIAAFVPSTGARILDVGCATGGLLATLKQRGYRHVLGADPSPACAAAARRLHDVDVRVATLAQLAEWKDRFDLILLVGVLEHLHEVRPAVETVARLLAPDGRLYCAQPDVVAFADCVNAPYQQFSVEHVNFFSETSLNRLMSVCGLESRQTWRWLVEWREGVTDSVVSGIFAPTVQVSGSRLQVAGDQPPPAAAPQISGSVPPSPVVPQLRRSVPSAPCSLPPAPSSSVPLSLSPSPSLSLFVDSTTAPAIERYLAKCGQEDRKLTAVIEQLVRSQEPVLVWGAGTLTRRLLATTRLVEANIVAFVDSNTGLQGQHLAGREIIAPAKLSGRPEAIVIASKAFEREILRQIHDQLRLSNRVILLG
ncbi:MAG: methyltransferase domain-containing protein [Opitutaceae bacterium]|nr:methyltransferase domain-containing protein [Opitutaceae bacterium]